MELSALEFGAGLVLVLAGSRRLPDGIDGLAERLRVSSGHLGTQKHPPAARPRRPRPN